MRNGFTLIELLISLAILAILATASYPGWQHWLAQEDQTLLQHQITRLLLFSRDEALVTNQEVFVSLQGDWMDISLADHKRLRLEKLKTHRGTVRLRSYPYYRQSIRFSPSDNMAADNAMFVYCSQNANNPAWAITVSQTGMVSAHQPDHEGYLYDSRRRRVTC